MKTVGVLGGMGPAATLDFLVRLHAATPAVRDQDHLRVITDSNPQVPDRNAALRGEGPSPGPMLASMARGLAAAGAGFLVMPCNAAHGWAADIEAAVEIPFVSMIDAAVAAVAATGVGRIGLLAVTATLDARLYQPQFDAAGIAVAVPDRAAFMALIYRIKAGDIGAEVRSGMAALADGLGDAGAGVILVACTEVPLVFGGQDCRMPVISATDALVAATLLAALET